MTTEMKQPRLEALIAQRVAQPFVSAFDLVKDLCGSIKEEPADLATNPEHLKGFGE